MFLPLTKHSLSQDNLQMTVPLARLTVCLATGTTWPLFHLILLDLQTRNKLSSPILGISVLINSISTVNTHGSIGDQFKFAMSLGVPVYFYLVVAIAATGDCRRVEHIPVDISVSSRIVLPMFARFSIFPREELEVSSAYVGDSFVIFRG